MHPRRKSWLRLWSGVCCAFSAHWWFYKQKLLRELQVAYNFKDRYSTAVFTALTQQQDNKCWSGWCLDHTSKVDEVHDAGLLAFTFVALDDLVERDGDDCVSSTTCRIHVGRRHCTTCCAYNARTQSLLVDVCALYMFHAHTHTCITWDHTRRLPVGYLACFPPATSCLNAICWLRVRFHNEHVHGIILFMTQ